MNNSSLAQACLGARSCLQVCSVKGKGTVELGLYASTSQPFSSTANQFFWNGIRCKARSLQLLLVAAVRKRVINTQLLGLKSEIQLHFLAGTVTLFDGDVFFCIKSKFRTHQEMEDLRGHLCAQWPWASWFNSTKHQETGQVHLQSQWLSHSDEA